MDTATRIAARKRDHLDLALAPASQSGVAAGWDDVHLVPAPLPGLSLDDVDLGTKWLGHRLRAPVVLVPMTGGHPDAAELNAVLGAAAQHLGLAVGVGSQRAALAAPELSGTFRAVRRAAPDAVVLANVGACQLVAQGDTPALSAADLRTVVDMVRADVLSIHLNVVQELLQPEGDRNTTGLLDAIGRAVAVSPVPVLVKETGAGFTRDAATALAGVGVSGLDVGGAGGTSFARIETARATEAGPHVPGFAAAVPGAAFADWGVPTAASVLEARGAGLPVVATGGVRNGVDAAKALALGATAVGVGRLAIEAATGGVASLVRRLEELLAELRAAMLLCGAATPAALARRPPVLDGFTRAWSLQRCL